MTHHEAHEAISDAANSAYRRLIEDGWTPEKLALALKIPLRVLSLRVDGGDQIRGGWSMSAIVDLAVATGQNPVRMLAREVLS